MSSGKIGLLFGSFNPIHTGHLILAEYMATATDLEEVWLVVSPQSPFKVGEELLPETARLELVQCALAGNHRLRALDVEFALPRPNYTIQTLDLLRKQHPERTFVLLMGGDNLPGLPRWKDADRLLREFEVYVYPRPGAAAVAPQPGIRMVEAPLLAISGTYVRQQVRAGASIRYLVPEPVREIIRQRGYWQS